ncbi:response regulator transcription factor [Aureisphaera galaxeae]|uniref:response regulator transcription factor n=1 Tax=Aureisphaera galaxeae TaxID=1538023 RepID=UPI002350EAC5|nr:response regulator transcription factor [Aureisphaera galaxeae]MDC8005698.1 response regulator transcription factor [Aureisphaera galaxeae]
MSKRYNILLAEDDENLGYILSEYLKLNGFEIRLVKNGADALKAFQQEPFGLGIFDVMMPIMDGFTLAKHIREASSSFPIIFLTAKGLKVDVLKGFKLGADDYIKKPVNEEELVARVHAVLRRTTSMTEAEVQEASVFEIGQYQFDYKNQTLQIADETVSLTQRESNILKLLCQYEGKILDRKMALRKLWGNSDYFNRKSMDVFIYKLRKYLAKDPKVSIKNIHGKGFILEVKETPYGDS